jgi:hypothetical protein
LPVLDLDPLSQSRPGTAGSLKRVGSNAGSRASSAGLTGRGSASAGRSVFHQQGGSGGDAGGEATAAGAGSSSTRNQRAAWPPVPLDESWVVAGEAEGDEVGADGSAGADTFHQEEGVQQGWHYSQGSESATTHTSDGLFSGSTFHSMPLPGVPEGDGEEGASVSGAPGYDSSEALQGSPSSDGTPGSTFSDQRGSTSGMPQGPVKTAGIGYTVVTSVAVPLVRKEDVQLAARSAALQEVEAGLLDPRQRERVQVGR